MLLGVELDVVVLVIRGGVSVGLIVWFVWVLDCLLVLGVFVVCYLCYWFGYFVWVG